MSRTKSSNYLAGFCVGLALIILGGLMIPTVAPGSLTMLIGLIVTIVFAWLWRRAKQID